MTPPAPAVYSPVKYFGHRVFVTIRTAYISLSPQYGPNTLVNLPANLSVPAPYSIQWECMWPMKLCLFYPRVLGNWQPLDKEWILCRKPCSQCEAMNGAANFKKKAIFFREKLNPFVLTVLYCTIGTTTSAMIMLKYSDQTSQLKDQVTWRSSHEILRSWLMINISSYIIIIKNWNSFRQPTTRLLLVE